MGGFVYFRCDDASGTAASGAGARALRMMNARGLEVAAVVKRPGFELHLYRKRRIQHDHLVEFDNGDFIAASGTLIYDGATGSRALTRLYDAFNSGEASFENLHGHFAVWVYSRGRLNLFNDYRGWQHVYHDVDFNLVSTSFLAIHAGTRICEPNMQEVYEYLTLSFYYGRRSLLKGINRLDRRYVHQLLPHAAAQEKPFGFADCAERGAFEDQVEHLHDLLRRYFECLVDIFGDRVSLGLTSGYDSRMTLAYLRLCGCRPNLYVQGPDDAIDVTVAKQIAAATGLPIAHDADAARSVIAKPDFERQVLASALYLDGVDHTGLFEDWALVAHARAQLPRSERLRLYGMVGEAFRRSISLPERNVSVRAFLRAWGEKTDNSSFRKPFSKTAYLRRIGDKLAEEIQLEGQSMTPVETQLAYPYFKGPANEGWQMSAQNERAYVLCPYADPGLIEAMRKVPMPYRRYGRFQSALMTRADPQIAAMPSSYGYSFSEGPPMLARWRTNAKHAIPTVLRPHLYRLRARRRQRAPRPYYLQRDYLRVVFPDGCPHLSPLLDLDAERDTGILSRAYTLEMLLSGRFLDLT